MGSETTRPTLLSRLRDGKDESAWREFEARYRDLIRRFCRRRGLQAADTEDVCQLVFLALARSMGAFRYDAERGRFRDYLGRVAQNTIHHLVSCPERSLRSLDNDMLEALCTSSEGDLDPSFEDEWTQHHFRLAMRSVRARSKPASLAVFERLLAGESVSEVARASRMSEEAVHKIKQRIGERLRREIENQVRDEEILDSSEGAGRSP